MKKVVGLLLSLILAACGVDGEPLPPEPEPERQSISGGVQIGGSVGMGVKR